MIELFSSCVWLFESTLSTAIELDIFRLIGSFVIYIAGLSLFRLALCNARSFIV